MGSKKLNFSFLISYELMKIAFETDTTRVFQLRFFC